jgi:hypothetical protein
MATEKATIKQVFQEIMPQANMRLAEPIILEELRREIDKGPRNKAPEADGIVHEFYNHFWDVITTDLLTIYNSILRNRDPHTAKPLARISVCRSVRHRVT